MRFLVLLLLFAVPTRIAAQRAFTGEPDSNFYKQKYLSFNPFSLLEGGLAIGAGFGNRFTKRSEYFSELSYLVRNPMYEYVNSLHGFRFIGQYRYHYFPSGGMLSARRTSREGVDHFAGVEFRLKQYYFADSLAFIKASAHDTLFNYPYHASATILAGAVFIGVSQNISANERWSIEFTFGIGIKQKLVKFNHIPKGYEAMIIQPIEWGYVPKIYESRNTVYIPSALRIKYRIR